MKTKYILLLPLLIFLQSCFVNQKSLYNQETKQNAKITRINVPLFLVKPYIKKSLREDGESEEIMNLIRKIKKVKIYTVENATDKMVADFSKQSFGSNLQEFMSVNSKDSKIKISSSNTINDHIIENLLIAVKSNKDLVYIKVLGKFSIDDISKLINSVDKNKENITKND